MTCSSPHPMRASGGIDVHSTLEVVGSHSTDAWARCRSCGAWFWLTTDLGSKWEYVDEWQIDKSLAERAFLGGDVDAATKLLVSSDLPRGPVWTSSSALVEMLRAITPGKTELERSKALGRTQPKGRWADAAKLLAEIATSAVPASSELSFLLDAKLPNRVFSEMHELGRSLVLFQTSPTHALVRIDEQAITESQSAGPMCLLARSDDALLFGFATSAGEGYCRIDAAGTLGSFAPSPTRYSVTSLDDGFWLFVPNDGRVVRHVQLHKPDAQPRVKLRMAFEQGVTDACPPRRMGEGWIVSGCVDDDGIEQALTLFDASFKTVAQSRGARGQRLISVIGETSVWCETARNPFVLERWERRRDVLERTFAIESQSWIRIEGGVVVSPREFDGGIIGYDDEGKQRFRSRRRTQGATYFTEVPGGLLVQNDAVAETIDPATGRTVAPSMAVESASVFVARSGTAYVRDRAALWVLAKTARKRIFVGEQTHLETTCGDDALLRDDTGACMLVGPDATVRGRFTARSAQFSVVGTRGGPYVLEPERLRIARFAVT